MRYHRCMYWVSFIFCFLSFPCWAIPNDEWRHFYHFRMNGAMIEAMCRHWSSGEGTHHCVGGGARGIRWSMIPESVMIVERPKKRRSQRAFFNLCSFLVLLMHFSFTIVLNIIPTKGMYSNMLFVSWLFLMCGFLMNLHFPMLVEHGYTQTVLSSLYVL